MLTNGFYVRYFVLQKDSKHGWHQKETVALSWLWPFFPVKTFSGLSHFSFLCFWDYSVMIYHHWQHINMILTDACLVLSILKWSPSWLWCTGGIISWVWGKIRLEEFLTMYVSWRNYYNRTNCKINLFMGNRISSMWDIKTAFTSFYKFGLEVLS